MKHNSREGVLDQSVLHLLHRAGQQAETLFMFENPADGMTPRQYAVLLAVSKQEDISQTGLVEATGIDRSTLADVVRRLVSRGMLQRKRTRHDARMYAVRISAKGKAALEAVAPAAKRADDRIVSVLRASQRTEFMACLESIVASLSKLDKAA